MAANDLLREKHITGERPKLTTSELIPLVDDVISNTGSRRQSIFTGGSSRD